MLGGRASGRVMQLGPDTEYSTCEYSRAPTASGTVARRAGLCKDYAELSEQGRHASPRVCSSTLHEPTRGMEVDVVVDVLDVIACRLVLNDGNFASTRPNRSLSMYLSAS